MSDIQIFNSVLMSENNKTIIIPNSMPGIGIIENSGKNPADMPLYKTTNTGAIIKQVYKMMICI